MKLIIDCDPGHDDAVAILTALHYADVIGITTVTGNAPLSHTTANALAVVAVAGADVRVCAGADRPLVGEPRHAAHVHGETGLGGVALPEHGRVVEDEHAVDFLLRASHAERDLWLAPIGPLTNIARALQRDPDFATRIAGISLMGGSASVGNVTRTAEFNIYADPEAADIVFRSGARIIMCGLNLTHQLMTSDDHVATLARLDNARSLLVADLFRFLHDRMEDITGERSSALHDPCAILALTHPDLLELREQAVSVELTGTHTRGMTVIDQRRARRTDPPNAFVAHHLDADRAMAAIIRALS